MEDHIYGHATITVDVKEPTSCIVLNTEGLSISNVSAGGGLGNDDSIKGRVHSTSEVRQATILSFDSTLPASLIYLHLDFDYHLNRDLSGLYKSMVDGASIVITQFEPISARAAFPCFDEPRFRSTFSFSISTTPGLTAALSNMPLISSTPTPATSETDRSSAAFIVSTLGFTTYQFGTSRPMPSHMLALVLGNLTSFDKPCTLTPPLNGSNLTLPLSAWVRSKWNSSQVSLMLSAACSSLQTLTTALNVPYPLPKLDIVAIPGFSAGGMENWGLILLSESRVIDAFDNPMDPLDSLNVVKLVSHEVAHQWFGNLLSIKSYAELWMKEGWATYLERFTAEAFHPEIYSWDRFYTEVTMVALSSDSPGSRPLSLQTPIESISEYDSLFGSISYDKGAAIVRMLRAVIEFSAGSRTNLVAKGPDGKPHLPLKKKRRVLLSRKASLSASSSRQDVFMDALHSFLTQHSEHSVSSSDLFVSMAESSGYDILHWMTNWTIQPGYPIISSSIHTLNGGLVLSLSQRPLSGKCDDQTGEGRWWVPITYKLQGATGMDDSSSFVALDSCNITIPLETSLNPSYALINIGRVAYHRSSYDSRGWQGLFLDASLLSAADIAGLLDDSYQLSYLGQLDTWAQSSSTFFMLCRELEGRQTLGYEPWKVALTNLGSASALMATAAAAPSLDDGYNATSCADALSRHIEQVTTPLLSSLGVNFTVVASESIDLRLLRPLALLTAGRSGFTALVNTAVELVLRSVKGGQPIPLSLRTVAYQLAVSSGNSTILKEIKDCYLSSSPDKSRCLVALGSCPPSKECLEFVLDLNFSREDQGRLLSDIALQGGRGFCLVWEWLIDQGGMDKLLKVWTYEGEGGGSLEASGVTYSLSRYLKDMTRLVMDETLLHKIERFASLHSNILDPDFVNAARESFDLNHAWRRGRTIDCQWLDPSSKPDDPN